MHAETAEFLKNVDVIELTPVPEELALLPIESDKKAEFFRKNS